jgi:hypothetical protein
MLRYVWLALASATLATVAHANGRAPATNGVFGQSTDSHSIYIRTTFGLLVSTDDGCSFRWTCEQNIGYGGTFDPSYAIASDGTLFATTFAGLRVSRDKGCSFTTATAELPVGDPGRIADMYVDAIDIGPTGEIWVATAESGKPNDVFRSADGGVTFASGGLASNVAFWNSVAIAHSDSQRIYVAGHQTSPSPSAHLFTTTNGGQMWTESALAGVQFAATPVIAVAAVDAAIAQRLYVVSVGANGTGDRLYRSTDGATTFAEVLATTQPIANVIIRDATTVFAVAGTGGSFRSDNGGMTFAPIASAPQLACLGARSDGSLVGCAANWDPDFMAVGVSVDGSQWQKLSRFIELDGTLACPPGTAGHDVCDPLWPTLREQFGATGPACPTATDLPFDPVDGVPPTKLTGCCDAGEGSPIGFVLLGLITAWIVGRRAPTRRSD